MCTLISKGCFLDCAGTVCIGDQCTVTADPMGILPLLRGCSHPTAAGVVTKDAEY